MWSTIRGLIKLIVIVALGALAIYVIGGLVVNTARTGDFGQGFRTTFNIPEPLITGSTATIKRVGSICIYTSETKNEFPVRAGETASGNDDGKEIILKADKECHVEVSDKEVAGKGSTLIPGDFSGGQSKAGDDVIWGTAGEAPQTPSDAAAVLGVPQDSLTWLGLKPGDPTVIGWKIGYSNYRTKLVTAKLTAGLCVDFPPSRATLTGSTEWLIKYDGVDWSRALMSGDGTIKSAEITVYWTPCEKGSNYSDSENPSNAKDTTDSESDKQNKTLNKSAETESETDTESDLVCPTTSAQAAELIGGNASNWKLLPNSDGTGWKYRGTSVSLKAPTYGVLNTPLGDKRNGETAKVKEATFWCLG